MSDQPGSSVRPLGGRNIDHGTDDEPAPTIADDDAPPGDPSEDFATVAFTVAPDEVEPATVGVDPGGEYEATGVIPPEVTPTPNAPTSYGSGPEAPGLPPAIAPGDAEPVGTVAATEAATQAATEAQDPHGTLQTIAGDADDATVAFHGEDPTQGGSTPGHAEGLCGRYLLKTFYARGGMGEVWLAEDPVIGRSVALKRILGDRPDQRKRFRVEAQITGRLEHPGIVPVHDLGFGALGEPFYVMKFVQGETLKKVLEAFHARGLLGDSLAAERVRLLQMFHSLCLTVAYAHSRGVIHRDLKPENVMIGPFGETIVLDWGIAKFIGEPDSPADGGGPSSAAAARLGDSLPDTGTHAGAVLGTPSYMAPEVAAGLNHEVDERSDIYLLGATLYEILSGKKPRSAKTVLEMITKAKHEPPKPVRSVNPLVPKALDAVCRKAMAHRKEDRYATATDLAEDVQRYIAGEPVSAYPEDALTRAWRWARRHRTALVRSAAAVLVASLAVFAFAKVRDAERRRAEAAVIADRLRAEDQARRDLREFRRLADEASFYAATSEPVSEQAPYYDPRKGQATATAALALAGAWGSSLERLPLTGEREPVKAELYRLLLLDAYLQSRQEPGPAGARRVLATLDRAVQLTGPTAAAYRLSAQACERLGDRPRAAEMLGKADDPKTPRTALDDFFQGERERDERAARVGEQTDRKPWQPDPARMEKAIAAYRRALAVEPDHFWSRFQLGRCLLSLGRLAEAVEALGACVALRPDSPWGYTSLGLAEAQQGRYAEAERDLDRAIRLDPAARPARLHRGFASWKQKRYEPALADFAAVLAPPDSQRLIEAAYYRGKLYQELGKNDLALADFDRVIAASPGFRSVYLDRAQVLAAKGGPAGDLSDLDAYIALSRPVKAGSWESHGLRGRLLLYLFKELPVQGRRGTAGRSMLALASAELVKAVNLGAPAAGVFDDLGAVREHQGQLILAIDAYTRGLRLAPDNAKLLIKRAWAYEQQNKHDKASADFSAAARSDPESAEAHTGLGYVEALRDRRPDAQREADLALLHGGENYLVLHNVACIYAALSRPDDADTAGSQEVAVSLLRRSVKLWKASGKEPSEIELMKGETAFKPLRGRKDFQELLRGGADPL